MKAKETKQGWFKDTILKYGIDLHLYSLPDIARFLGYKERNFYIKVERMNFDYWQLIDLVNQLHFKDDDRLKLMGRW